MDFLEPIEGGQQFSRMLLGFDETTVLVRASSQRMAKLEPDSYEYEVCESLATLEPSAVVELRTSRDSHGIVKSTLWKYVVDITTYQEVTASHGQQADPDIVTAGDMAWALHQRLSQEEQIHTFRAEIEAFAGDSSGPQDS
jgi:hypothetical protein